MVNVYHPHIHNDSTTNFPFNAQPGANRWIGCFGSGWRCPCPKKSLEEPEVINNLFSTEIKNIIKNYCTQFNLVRSIKHTLK